jgi:hypothetical protein
VLRDRSVCGFHPKFSSHPPPITHCTTSSDYRRRIVNWREIAISLIEAANSQLVKSPDCDN